MKEIIEKLKTVGFDEIVDWLDAAEFMHARDLDDEDYQSRVMQRRKGKKSLRDMTLSQESDTALIEFLNMNRAERGDVLIAVEGMAAALKPVSRRRGGEGYLQAKIIRRYAYNPFSGEPILDEKGNHVFTDYGPYLYLRMWRTGGDWRSDKRRLASIYIGGKSKTGEARYPYPALAGAMLVAVVETDNGKIRTEEGIELERLIMAHIDITQDPPLIDYIALDKLEMMVKQSGE